MALSCSTSWRSRSASALRWAMARSASIRAPSEFLRASASRWRTACSRSIRAVSSLCWARCSACAVSARVSAVLLAMSRSCASSASRVARWISSCLSAVSRSFSATATSASRTVALRSLRRCSVISLSRARPSASKELSGLKCSIEVWSSRVSEADSSSRPLWRRSPETASCTPFTKSARFSWRSGRVMPAATARRASTNFASISSRSSIASLVRSPSVCAASAIDSSLGSTRT
ncbi:hypothetical protein CHKEEEPN_2676 [Methylorubrum podarium]|nr:hypothetical protein CHKEEEPN_2676 [Methylorubrum podarium]